MKTTLASVAEFTDSTKTYGRILDDAAVYGISQESSVEVRFIHSQARRFICSVTLPSSPLKRTTYGYVLKTNTSPSEGERSYKASSLQLGPRVIVTSRAMTVEELLPEQANPRITSSLPSTAVQLADKLIRMIENDYFHSLHALEDHLYILRGDALNVDVRFINWSGGGSAPSGSVRREYLVSKVIGICVTADRLVNVHGYRVFRNILLAHDQPGSEIRSLLFMAEHWLTTSGETRFTQHRKAHWRDLLDQVNRRANEPVGNELSCDGNSDARQTTFESRLAAASLVPQGE